MATPHTLTQRPRPAAARPAIVRAARTLLARDGWTHCTADAIAAEAALPPGTVRDHFPDQEKLLLSVLLDSTAAVAAALAHVADSHLTEVTDLEADLIALGRAWLAPLDAFREHFAIVRHISAEVTRLPVEAVEKWQAAGPRQARRHLARRLRHVADQGLLDITDADQAAERFILLVPSGVVQRTFHGALPLTRRETDTLIADGVTDFIRLYAPPAPRPAP
ncbi:TetR/AcrR family transcriptional regulator C-terminal domain-containing protein [Streptomyces sp. CAU 1734]|uniref:TetR/AcrR family transcriptional regulator C-terminal domain-containing protein n=1 Tax=Streptomyces sp. CAU 1734 TaxID=3140360 RepID=UPI00326071EF